MINVAHNQLGKRNYALLTVRGIERFDVFIPGLHDMGALWSFMPQGRRVPCGRGPKTSEAHAMYRPTSDQTAVNPSMCQLTASRRLTVNCHNRGLLLESFSLRKRRERGTDG